MVAGRGTRFFFDFNRFFFPRLFSPVVFAVRFFKMLSLEDFLMPGFAVGPPFVSLHFSLVGFALRAVLKTGRFQFANFQLPPLEPLP